jgi:GNAT superfamily N-acetyltransferase
MRHEHWVRFTWELADLPATLPQVPKGYDLRPAQKEDAEELSKMVLRSFVLDAAWNAAIHELTSLVSYWLDRAFRDEHTTVLALRHGNRIIGAAAVSIDTESNLAPGPCVLLEYRNRGFGNLLLAHALDVVRSGGSPIATAVTKDGAPVARFLYPKFGGSSIEHNIVALEAA